MKILTLVLLSMAMSTGFASDQPILIDVRELDEVSHGMLDGALWFPLSKIQKDPQWKIDFIKRTQGKKIQLYCRSGNRAGVVQKLLKEMGIDSQNLGGYEDLINQKR